MKMTIFTNLNQSLFMDSKKSFDEGITKVGTNYDGSISLSLSDFKLKTPDERKEFLLRYWKLDGSLEEDNTFVLVGTYKKAEKPDKNGDEFGFFTDIRNTAGDILFYPFGLGKVSVYSRHNPKYEKNEFWQLKLDIDCVRQSEKNPFLLHLITCKPGVPSEGFQDKVRKEAFIKEIFENTGYTDRDAQNEANALSRFMGDLYTETERFIFELLQNADDQPNKSNEVAVTLRIVDNQLLFMHNGKPFDDADVESISSIGSSTKRLDSEKIGYKGIGFKSVFSDSETVFVNSGAFSFSFDKKSWYYRDKKDMEKVPWQIKPIWAEKYRYPKAVQEDSLFFKSPVGIALTIPYRKIRDYEYLISDLLHEPRFILFLRNVSSITYFDKGSRRISIKKSHDNDACRITVNDNVSSEWNTTDFILDIDEETSKLIEDDKLVPQKLKEITKTKVTFAAMVKDGTMVPIQKEQSRLFTYLPTRVDSFEFPFLVNADFLTTANREDIHYNNNWNIFLFKEIGNKVVDWVISMADKTENYLDLLPGKTLVADEQDSHYKLVQAFNESYLAALNEKAFIKVNDEGNPMRRQDEIILDKSGLAGIIGEKSFVALINSKKSLPSRLINSNILKAKLFDKIERINLEEVAQGLKQNLPVISEWLRDAKEEKKQSFFEWIKEHSEECKGIVDALPILQYGTEWISVKDAIEKGYVITTSKVLPEKTLLGKLGIRCSENSIDDHPLSSLLITQKGEQIFNIIANGIEPATSDERARIVAFFEKLEGIEKTKIAELCFFHNALGQLTALNSMIPFNSSVPDWMKPFMVAQAENYVGIQHFLVPLDDAFKRIVMNNLSTISVDYNELYDFFKWTDARDTQKIIDHLKAAGELNKIIDFIATRDYEIKKYYLDSIQSINLIAGSHYSSNSYEYKVLTLAVGTLEDPAIFAEKVLVGGSSITSYSVDDDIVCKDGDGREIHMSLSRLLPDYQNQLNRVDEVKALFDSSIPWSKLIKSKKKTAPWVKEKLDQMCGIGRLYSGPWKVEWKGNAIQYLFLVHSRRREWTSVYGFDIELKNESDGFVNELMDFLFNNQLIVASSYFTCKLKGYFTGKFFASDYSTASEQLLPSIERWADTEEKRAYLLENGVKDASDNAIRFREAFLLNEMTDAYVELTEKEVLASFDFLFDVKSTKWPEPGDKQILYLRKYAELNNCNVSLEVDLELLHSGANIMNTQGYTAWRANHYPEIYLYDGEMPFAIKANDGATIAKYQSGDWYYEKKSTDEEGLLFVNGKGDITSILRRIATTEAPDVFTENDWNDLFLISRSEADALNKENEELKSKIAEYEKQLELLSSQALQDPIDNKDVPERGNVEKVNQEKINREVRIKVKPYLSAKGYDVSGWTPETSSSDIENIIKDPDGTPINVVVRSANQGIIHLSASSFEVLTSNPNNLLIVENHDGIKCVGFEELFGTNSTVSLLFDAKYTPLQYFQALGTLFKYVKNTTFVVKDPNYSAIDEIRGFGYDNKTDGPIIRRSLNSI